MSPLLKPQKDLHFYVKSCNHFRKHLYLLNSVAYFAKNNNLKKYVVIMIVLSTGQFFGDVCHFFHEQNLTLSVTDYNRADREASEMHYHLHPNIFFVLQGGVLEKARKTSNENLTGSISFYDAGEPHQNIRKLFPLKSINIEIEESFYREYEINSKQLREIVLNNPDVKFKLLQVYHEILENDSLTALSVKLGLLDLLNWCKNLPMRSQWPVWMLRLNELLQDRWNNVPTLAELSRETGVHPVTISKHFPAYMGCTLGQYLRKLKIDRSLALIRADVPLSTIAHECGFSDQSHFIRNFKRYTSYRPLAYKRISG